MAGDADCSSRKSNGIHYTPEKLANFLASRLWNHASADLVKSDRPIRILDPACGDGALLEALMRLLPNRPCIAVGFETNEQAVAQATAKLSPFQNADVQIHYGDFLDYALNSPESTFDIAITNPPYVRTQVMGRRQSQKLAAQFGLTGRVDLYQAFLFATTNVLIDGGWIGALTSNRFLYTQSGKSTRILLSDQYTLSELYDLGDSRLFEAAVLPAIFVASKSFVADHSGSADLEKKQVCSFVRIENSAETVGSNEESDFFTAIVKTAEGCASSFLYDGARYAIQAGVLNIDEDGSVWQLENAESRQWLARISGTQQLTFGDVAHVKVGIKTTADSVFIRSDWDELPPEIRPETELLRTLITHKDVARWVAKPATTQVLYPYQNKANRTPVKLDLFPRGQAYLNQHFQRLNGRKYISQAGRQWFEIWVPHRATDWSGKKLVWPDISEQPRFFLDASGAVVNGDCYWIKLKDGQPDDLLYLILAVANSKVVQRFYDYRFHNKLYGRRRRFISQYVRQFPLPDRTSPESQRIINLVKRRSISGTLTEQLALESKIDEMVHLAFGLTAPAAISSEV